MDPIMDPNMRVLIVLTHVPSLCTHVIILIMSSDNTVILFRPIMGL
jgi:hypothetical protein